jgi:nicotinamidase-related amidase
MLFRLHTRRRDVSVVDLWEAHETAVIICDVWDDHWCKCAATRSSELAPRINDFARAARSRGALIVHAPSDTMHFYAGMPQRERARKARRFVPPIPIVMRWSDRSREPDLPIDDSDGGCDDNPPHPPEQSFPWTRQHAAIVVEDDDIITDDGQEIYNVFKSVGIRNVFLTGVHTNKCVLVRPYGIRQLVMLGMRVVLVRDLTDSLYNPRMRPYVEHARGTELVVDHIEVYWCPSILSTDVVSL